MVWHDTRGHKRSRGVTFDHKVIKGHRKIKSSFTRLCCKDFERVTWYLCPFDTILHPKQMHNRRLWLLRWILELFGSKNRIIWGHSRLFGVFHGHLRPGKVTYESFLCNFAWSAVIFMIFIFKWIFVHCFLKFDIILCNLSNCFLEARLVKPGGQSSPYRRFKFSIFAFFFFENVSIFETFLKFFCNFILVIITRSTQLGDYQVPLSA